MWTAGALRTIRKIHAQERIDWVFSEAGAVRKIIEEIKRMDIPVATFVHSLSLHYFYNKWQEVDGLRALRSYLVRTLPKIVYDIFINDIKFLRKCDIVVTGSKRIGIHLTRYYGLDAKRVRVVNNWIDSEKIVRLPREEARQLRRRHDIRDEATVFMVVGSVWRPKGFRIACKAFQGVVRKFPTSLLLIIGEGPDIPWIKRFVAQTPQLINQIRLLGPIPNRDIASFLSIADIFIIPSLINEVLAYTVLEAMACGLPVIASDIYANFDALGKNGEIVRRGNVEQLGKAMMKMFGDTFSREAIGKKNRARVIEKFSKEKATKRIERIINRDPKEQGIK